VIQSRPRNRPVRRIADELDWGRRKLARAGKQRPESWALTIWAAVAREKPGMVWLGRVDQPDPVLARDYRRAVSSYAAGAPFQTAVGVGAFRTIELGVTPDVLIPRVETEDLVAHVLEWSRSTGAGGIAADLGTGTGAIALALAIEGSFDRIIATDVSPAALAVAARNAQSLAPRTSIEFRRGSWLAPLRGDRVHVVVSNPPYLTASECELLPPEVRDYEPRLALDGGADGMDPYREILRGAAHSLVAGGLLALEIDSRRAGETLALAHDTGWAAPRVESDVFGRPRYLLTTNGKG
jgi:release factor glutamine methyltransferase